MSSPDDQSTPPVEETREDHLKFLFHSWDLLAAAAWEGYSAEGRGAIIIDPKESSQWSSSAIYVPESRPRPPGVPTWPDPEVEEMVGKYDPEREVVVVILRLDGDVSTYQLPTPNRAHTPPAAFTAMEQAKGEKN
jgi:hypothetical protein